MIAHRVIAQRKMSEPPILSKRVANEAAASRATTVAPHV
eukprot:CAMPEP_0181233130 /NCGR_PEP_ID=MMETSP1096-20121128/36156_1 /TAXON_ID=156174 ORGANISM="Chrysochromulina ericina, Strain CCMP281" /NCGR_SAMPLE_ID=MMETSP1096 /ASSEMBLY_ACC=CAM_ASM_000453 /LENGTH=38 /DNA_ID= /DNA_START= /DNA_END= /DNA_ORIENTATION=